MQYTLFPIFTRQFLGRLSRGLSFLLLALVLITTCTNSSSFAANDACNIDVQMAQRSCREKQMLDQALWQAQTSSIEGTQLQPVYAEETQISQNGASSYSIQIQQYQQLLVQVQQVVKEQLQSEARVLISQLHDEVRAWGQAHLYVDSFDGHSYLLDSGYAEQGIGASLDSTLAAAHTTPALRKLIKQAQDTLFDFHMLEMDYRDSTPFNVVHQVDSQILTHYHLQKGQVLLISLVGQAMRIYQDGKLARAFLVTTGRPENPSLPGIWHTLMRFSPTIFLAPFPKNSPDWFPPTLINYAILYHMGGYFIHDAWWRANYGPGTQFPHADSSGNTLFSGTGSHGCVNLQEQTATWLYQHTDWNTTIVIY